jgi:hypothetical protein
MIRRIVEYITNNKNERVDTAEKINKLGFEQIYLENLKEQSCKE